jgi:hypothetical protein
MSTRTSALCLIALAGLGCSQTSQPTPDAQPAPLPAGEFGKLELPDELAGCTVLVEEDGAWSYRKAGRPGGRGHYESEDVAAMAPATGKMERRFRAEGAPAAPGEPAGDMARTPGRVQRPGTALRAGATDDNEDFDAYLDFLDTWRGRDLSGGYDDLDVTDRRFVRVEDASGNPVPGATVAIVDVQKDRVVHSGTTYGDGRVPYYPNLGNDGAPASMIVEAAIGRQRVREVWDGAQDLVLRVDAGQANANGSLKLDVLFLIDTTGSMGDEIASIKGALLGVTDKLRSLEREFDLRYGSVLFRDIGDAYVTATHDFTSDIEAFDQALKAVHAAGGGDGPESVNQGLAVAIDGAKWRDGAAKVVFLIGDAPPHMDYAGDVSYGASVRAAVAKGIRVHSVAASGLDPRGTLVFRQIAQFTRGKFVFIEYGTPDASAASHGVTGKVKSNNLDDILFEQIRDELAHWGRDAT